MKTKNIFFLAWIFLVITSALLLTRNVSAQQPTPSDDQVNAIARQLYCPVCENIPLDVCPTTACAQWRELIRQKLAEGKTDQEIKDYFVQQYGARVISTRSRLVYLIPVVAILAGTYILYRAFRSWKRPTQSNLPTPSTEGPPTGEKTVQDEYVRRLEDEVRKR